MLYPQILSAHTKDLVHVTPPCALFPTDSNNDYETGEVGVLRGTREPSKYWPIYPL